MGAIKPQPQILTIWRISLALAMCVPAFLTSLFFSVSSGPWLWGTALWITVFLLLYLVYLPLCYRRMSYSVSGERILLYSGVLYSRMRNVPLSGVQFTSLTAGPIERMLGICSLVVTSAGGRTVLPGLRRQDAEALAASLGDRR